MTKTDALIMKPVIFSVQNQHRPLYEEENAPIFQDAEIASDKKNA